MPITPHASIAPPAAPPAKIPAPPPPLRAGERKTPDRPCLNCGDPTVGSFCPVCGQRKVEVHVSLHRLAMDVLDDQLSINSALPRTLAALFFRPGHLTREYMAGRIARYIPPFRLYLVSSVVFFLVLSLFSGIGEGARVDLGGIVVSDDSAAAPAPARVDSARAAAARTDSAPAKDWTEEIRIS